MWRFECAVYGMDLSRARGKWNGSIFGLRMTKNI